MARDFFINGETMVSVKGRSDSDISAITQLGLSDSQIRVTLDFRHLDLNVNAWGEMPADVQWMLAGANISMTLVHFDRAVLDVCLMESMGGVPNGAVGGMNRAGQRLGNNAPRFAAGGVNGNHLIGLNLSSTVGAKPWRFFYTYLAAPPMEFPLGNERSIIVLNWRAIPYTQDPWGGSSSQPNTVAGTGAQGALLWDHTLDS
jgi:hypothetical protein